MATTNYNPFDIPKGGYTAFDALSLRQLIINRLNEQGTFTDQNYIGSNLASVIDIIAYAYNTLIFYLNRTSTESMFTEAQLYENINRIVKLIDYSPIGYQTSTLSFSCSTLGLTTGLYTLPRYSYVVAAGNIPFSINEDLTFNKTVNTSVEYIRELSEQKLLYQGIYQEYPLYTATGENNEIVILNPGNELVDHFNIDVYVKPILTNKWEQFTKTTSLYLEDSLAKKYEIRLNSNKRYEIKFGDDISGYKLKAGDQVAIYYLNSSGSNGVVQAGSLGEFSTPAIFNSTQYNQILTDVLKDQYRLITTGNSSTVLFSNNVGSTDFVEQETPEQIRTNAPAVYRSQYRLITARDFEAYIRSNFAYLLSDIKVYSNQEYISTYLKYFHELGLTNPEDTGRALFNQVYFADSCNFNNVYLLLVPRFVSDNINFVGTAQKELISTALRDVKPITTEIMFMDPVYMAVGFGTTDDISSVNPNVDTGNCYLNIIKETSSRRSNDAITQEVLTIITNYFSQTTPKLGETLLLQQLNQDILSVDGVIDFYTERNDSSTRTKGLSLYFWNPNYTDKDKRIITNNTPLLPFQYSYLYDIETINNRIKITSAPTLLTSR